MSDLHARLVAELGKPYEIWAPGNVVTPIARQRAALLAVVELHAPFQRSTLSVACRACSTPVHTKPGRYATVTPWPCSTIQAVADQLGAALEEPT